MINFIVNLTAFTQQFQTSNFRFKHQDIDLNNNSIESILQDRYGFVWIGTLGGLHRYDGVNVNTFLSSDDSTTISGNRAGVLFEDSKNRFWIGTENGICRFDWKNEQFIRYETEKNSSVLNQTNQLHRVNAITEDKNGRLWIGSEREGLLYLDEGNGKFRPYFNNPESAIHHASIFSLASNGDSWLWIGTSNNGLTRLNLDTGEFEKFQHNPGDDNSIAGNYIEDILIDDQNRVWLATHENGLDQLINMDGKTTIRHYVHNLENSNSLFNNDVTTVYQDGEGRIWVCNENGGLHLYNPAGDNFIRLLPEANNPSSISNISVKEVYEDQQKRLWIGSNLEGIDIMDKFEFRFEHYQQNSDQNWLNNNIIRSMLENPNGDIWIATDGGGLNLFNRNSNTFRSYQHEPEDTNTIRSNAVLGLAYDQDNHLWVGTWRGGVNVLDDARGTFSTKGGDLNAINKIFNINRDNTNRMWISTQSGGLTVYNPKDNEFSTYLHNPEDSNSIADNDIIMAFQDSKNRIWVCTEFNGLDQIILQDDSSYHFKHYVHLPSDSTSLAHNMVNHIHEDQTGRVWIATEGGLSVYQDATDNFQSFNTWHGLNSNHIKSINHDDQGNIWIGTTNGISKFDPVKKIFRNYTENDGLQSGEFTRYSVLKTKSGELLFGGTNGFNIFHPDSIKDNPFLPKVYLTGLKIFNKPVEIGKESPLQSNIMNQSEITLTYKQSVFTLDFVGINFTHPEMNQYAFKLDNFESDWNYVGNQRSATYTNLDPGTYVFHVKASNNDGVWNDNSTQLVIHITPPFWQTFIFKLMVFVVLFGLIYAVVNYRIKRLNRANLALENKVNDRTSQLNQLVEELKQKQHEIETTNEELKEIHVELERINSQLDKRVQERTSKLVKANEQLDRFVYSASHDLSAPLKSILGLINITKLENDNLTIESHLNHMEKSVLKLEDVISHLTMFSRNMGSEIQLVTFAFDDIIEEVLDDLWFLISEKNIQIIKEYEAKQVMQSDFLRMKIILTNLISNAIKYGDRQKNECFVRIVYSKHDENSVITIEDNGMGIKPEYQHKIYDMFFRVSNDSQGSGLGLFIVKETIDKLKGKINIRSELGKYTIFTISLPESI